MMRERVPADGQVYISSPLRPFIKNPEHIATTLSVSQTEFPKGYCRSPYSLLRKFVFLGSFLPSSKSAYRPRTEGH